MLAALSTVYDKESGVMRMLVIAPIEHYWIAVAKALGATLSALVQALMLLVILALLGYVSREVSIPLLALGLLGTALACASLGMLVAAWSRTLDNYATMMNLVIFPVFFLSGSLYPVQQLPDGAATRRDAESLYLRRRFAQARRPGRPDASPQRADFGIGLDLAVLVGFSVAALAVAGIRFSRDTASEPLVHRLARKHEE